MLTNEFFNRDAAVVAKDLLGKVLRVNYNGVWLAAMLIETEAYYLHEKGSHASLGFTPKRSALFMPPGTIYMYHARGGDSLNTSCRGAGNAVLFKSGIAYIDENSSSKMLNLMHQLNPMKDRKRHDKKLCSGQTLLCKSLGLKVKVWDQKNYDPEKFFIEDVNYRPHKIIQTTRLGIPPGRDEHLMLRFIDYQFVNYATSNPLTKKKFRRGKDYKIINLHPLPLKDLKILLTRPRHQTKKLATDIRALGGKPIIFPTLAIAAPRDKTSLSQVLQQLNTVDIAIFTSANAVTKIRSSLKKFPQKIIIIASGPATAKTLTPFFSRVVIPESPFTSEKMLDLPQLQQVIKKNIGIFTGEEGRNVLAETLQQRGANIFLAKVYRRICPKIKNPAQKLPLKNSHLIASSSYEGLQNLLAIAGKTKDQILTKPLLVSSERLLLLAKKLGFKELILAENATDEAILKALKAWYAKRFANSSVKILSEKARI